MKRWMVVGVLCGVVVCGAVLVAGQSEDLWKQQERSQDKADRREQREEWRRANEEMDKLNQELQDLKKGTGLDLPPQKMEPHIQNPEPRNR